MDRRGVGAGIVSPRTHPVNTIEANSHRQGRRSGGILHLQSRLGSSRERCPGSKRGWVGEAVRSVYSALVVSMCLTHIRDISSTYSIVCASYL